MGDITGDPVFQRKRLRRLRQNRNIRALVQENHLSIDDLIWPIFVRDGEGLEEPIASMPGVFRYSVDRAVIAAKHAAELGIGAICVFPYTELSKRTADCSAAWSPDNPANRAIAAIKTALPQLLVMTDVALDCYNIDGQDGFVEDGRVVNERTVEALVKMALVQADMGADIIGPSDMMDGRVGAIRAALDTHAHRDVLILSYAAKFASSFYGPFRDAVGASSALKGDKKTYQINPANASEALRCVARDLDEGADMVMVKPGMPYLDICRTVKDRFGAPTFAYQVSGEYAMLVAAAEQGWLTRDQIVAESLLAFKRAGCDGVLTYFAPEVAKALQ